MRLQLIQNINITLKMCSNAAEDIVALSVSRVFWLCNDCEGRGRCREMFLNYFLKVVGRFGMSALTVREITVGHGLEFMGVFIT